MDPEPAGTPPPHATPDPAAIVRVAVVDEYPLHREGVTRAFERSSSMRVVFTASSGQQLLDAMDVAVPDVVLIEPWMRCGDGISCVRSIRATHPDVTVIALSHLWDGTHVDGARSAGVAAHVPKTVALDDLPALVRQVLQGIEIRPPAILDGAGRMRLTRREMEILTRVATGASNAAIAQDLFVTQQTVKFHLSNIYRTLGAQNRTEAVHRASRDGLLG